MAEGQYPNLRLDSWKSIAAYLGRDVRTVIRWEQTRGLPVRRLPGVKRSAVYAFQHEIDTWLRSQVADLDVQPRDDTQAKEGLEVARAARQFGEHTAIPEAEVGDQIHPQGPFGIQRHRHLWSVALALAILLVGVGLGVARPNRAPQLPTRLVFTSDSLQAWDDANQLVWEHRFPEPFANTLTTRDINPSTGQYVDPSSVSRASLYDLFGDGRREALAITLFPSDGSVADVQRQIL